METKTFYPLNHVTPKVRTGAKGNQHIIIYHEIFHKKFLSEPDRFMFQFRIKLTVSTTNSKYTNITSVYRTRKCVKDMVDNLLQGRMVPEGHTRSKA